MSERPMASDRRVLAIAAVVVVGLIGIGAVSAQLLTASACDDIEPQQTDARPAGTDPAVVLESALPDLDDGQQAALRSALNAMTARLGPVTGVADVRGAERLAPVADHVAAVGPVTTVLDPGLAAVTATAAFDDAVVAGDGTTLWSLALVNEVTGQVDALQPLDGRLEAGTCVDTATVGTPFAFLLDAGDGELLLLRTDEEGERPSAELRGRDGRTWTVPLELPMAPPGVVAERLLGALGQDVVVLGHRAAEEDDPALVALARADGTVRWTVDLADLEPAAPAGEGPLWARPLLVGEEVAVVALARDDEPERASFVAVDPDEGRLLWTADLDGPRELLAAELTADRLVLVVREAVVTAYEVDPDDGSSRPRVGSSGETAQVAVTGDGRILLALDEELVVVTDEAADSVGTDVRVADVAVAGSGRVVVLLRSGAGAAAVAFGDDGRVGP